MTDIQAWICPVCGETAYCEQNGHRSCMGCWYGQDSKDAAIYIQKLIAENTALRNELDDWRNASWAAELRENNRLLSAENLTLRGDFKQYYEAWENAQDELAALRERCVEIEKMPDPADLILNAQLTGKRPE